MFSLNSVFVCWVLQIPKQKQANLLLFDLLGTCGEMYKLSVRNIYFGNFSIIDKRYFFFCVVKRNGFQSRDSSHNTNNCISVFKTHLKHLQVRLDTFLKQPKHGGYAWIKVRKDRLLNQLCSYPLLDIMSLGWDGDEKAVSESNFLEVIIFSNSVSLMTVQFSE